MQVVAPDANDVTRFGAGWYPLSRSAALLRARATALGVALYPAEPVEMAAAVVATELWLASTRIDSLEHTAQSTPEARLALALSLRRAAGAHLGVDEELLGRLALVGITDDPDLVANAYRLAAWCDCLELDPALVLHRAASDLAHGGPKLARLAALLVTVADDLDT